MRAVQMGVDDAELQALAQQVRWHLNTPEAKAAMQRRIESVPITCKYARACMERHQSANNLFAAREQVCLACTRAFMPLYKAACFPHPKVVGGQSACAHHGSWAVCSAAT